jgi:thymidylate kinase
MMPLLAQIETATELARHAQAEGGWIAMALVVLVTSALGLFAYMVRGDRVELREINRFVRTEMPDVIDGITVMLARFVAAERKCPAFRDSDLARIESGNGTRMSDAEIAELDVTAKKAVERMQKRQRRRESGDRDESSQG